LSSQLWVPLRTVISTRLKPGADETGMIEEFLRANHRFPFDLAAFTHKTWAREFEFDSGSATAHEELSQRQWQPDCRAGHQLCD
jgi:hypothetical protein